MIPVFDGHNDILLRILQKPEQREAIWLTGEGKGHLDLPRMAQGGFMGGFFAIYMPSPHDPNADMDVLMDSPPYQVPLPSSLSLAPCQSVAVHLAAQFLWMERASGGRFRQVRSVAEIKAAQAAGVISGVMHMEGAEAIDPACDALYLWHQVGLRSLGPVWSRPTAFAHGVPFAFPSTPDIGPGLTEAGKRLVKTCNELKVMIDLSHLNLKGFEDVASLSDAPLVATHSNAHAVTPSSRNLMDCQLDMIRETKGMVGLNFATFFLRTDGRRDSAMGWEAILQHLDHLIGRLGEDHVGFGSDFDGAIVPDGIVDVVGLPRLIDAMLAHGYGENLVRKLAWDNWLGVLNRTWGG